MGAICIEEVNDLRCQMLKVAEEKGSLTDPDVVAISQRLDVLIVDLQRKIIQSQISIDALQYHIH